ncbi:MAG: guanylate kinase [Gammaproteobacteria bacterium]
MKQGIPFIIAAPSGGGKTSLVDALVKHVENLIVSISYTTRTMRPGEKDGVNYHFVSQTQFENLIAERAFLEYAKVFEHYYGTNRYWVEEKLEQGLDVILEIDWQGARQIRAQLEDAVSIFILPPSLEVLHSRLETRGQDKPETIEKRMKAAQNEIRQYETFDYLIVNDDFDQALNDLTMIIYAEHLRRARQTQKLAKLITNLLQ